MTSMEENDDNARMYDDHGYFGSRLREWRHNPCLMEPISVAMILVLGIFMFVTLLLQVPTLVLGFLLAPILSRNAWYVEFLYPSWDIARWAHFFLMRKAKAKSKSDDKNRGFHSRTIEQRVEVVPGRVYIHPIPQFLDNLGYLIVCLPEPPQKEKKGNVKISIEDKSEESNAILAIIIDCGEASEVSRAIQLIQQYHYRKQAIQVRAILSTHKHHDHTGGNADLRESKVGSNITNIYGGAVEKVPHCTDFLVDGDRIDLPKLGRTNMNDCIQIEAVAVPAHTRGSLVYRLSSTNPNQSEFLFTGDTMFSGGAGVSFEADTGVDSESKINRSNANTFVRAGLGASAMERCFAEILVRGMTGRGDGYSITDKILIFPGHEYTSELLSRQLMNTTNEACRWKNFVPRDFFDTVSHMFVALHRRNLPHNSGKLLLVPSTLRREIHISPQFRSLRRSGELVIRAIQFWFENICSNNDRKSVDDKTTNVLESGATINTDPKLKTSSTARKWNIQPDEVSQNTFTTIYTADLNSIIDDLSSKKVSNMEAVTRLRDLSHRLEEPVINRRVIPGYIPSDKSIYRGIAGLVFLGSPPSAMTLTDSRTMKIAPPIDSNSDRIIISKGRLLLVLGRLGFLEGNNADVPRQLNLLWDEANNLLSTSGDNKADSESGAQDGIELGVLKWIIYGVPANQPSWFSKMCCMPCSNIPEERTFPESHPTKKMKQKSGDLVSHDVLTCKLCRTATGCIHKENKDSGFAVPESSVDEIEVMAESDIEEDEISNEHIGTNGGKADEETKRGNMRLKRVPRDETRSLSSFNDDKRPEQIEERL